MKALLLIFTLSAGHALASPHFEVDKCLSGHSRKASCTKMIENFWRYNDQLDRAARSKGLDPSLIKAMAAVESRFNADAISPKGATGLLQIMPATGSMLGVHPTRLSTSSVNAEAGAQYVRDMYFKFRDWRLAIAAYNAGPGAVAKYGNKIPPYAETQSYVVQVLALYARFKQSERLHTKTDLPPAPTQPAQQMVRVEQPIKKISVSPDHNRFNQTVIRVGKFQYLENRE